MSCIRFKFLAIAFVYFLGGLLVGCGGGGGDGPSGVPPPTPKPTELTLLWSSIPEAAVAVVTSPDLLYEFDTPVADQNLSTFVELKTGATSVPLLLELNAGKIRIRTAQPLKLRQDYVLTFKAGLKGTNGTTVRADIVRHFRTIIIDGAFKTVFPAISGLMNFSGSYMIRVADVNGDGLPDIVQMGGDMSLSQTNNAFGVQTILQNPDHTFRLGQNLSIYSSEKVYSEQKGDMAIVDLDHDGVPEIVIAMLRHAPLKDGLMVLKQDSAGNYQVSEFIETEFAFRLAVADIDGDGKPDLVGVGAGSSTTDGITRCGAVAVLSSATGARLQAPNPLPCGAFASVNVARMEKSGSLTLALLAADNGSGVAQTVSQSASFYDIDARGHLDVNVHLMTAIQQICPTGMTCSWFKLLDADGDGIQDLAIFGKIIDTEITAVVFHQNSLGTYTELWRTPAASVLRVADMDRDGIDDFVALPLWFGGQGLAFILGDKQKQSMELSHVTMLSVPDLMYSDIVAVQDMDGDGWPDVVISSYNMGILVFYQTGR